MRDLRANVSNAARLRPFRWDLSTAAVGQQPPFRARRDFANKRPFRIISTTAVRLGGESLSIAFTKPVPRKEVP